MGCQFDDWMFRFFWFLLRGSVNTEASGQVAVEIKNDDNLKIYLENEKVKIFANARYFMKEAADYINQATDMENLPRKDNGVFISYAHEDRYIALPLFEKLNAAGINVWIDEEKLECGDKYGQRIQKVVENCSIFMPILSSQVKSDLDNNVIIDRWYRKEWQWIQERYENEQHLTGKAVLKTIPIIVGNYH